MINGIKYLPFRLYTKYDINRSNYKYIKYHNYDKFWYIHKENNLMMQCNINSKEKDMLCNLFEEMFSYSPYDKLSTDNILKHEFIVNESKHHDLSFNLNDAQLESFVRDIYNKTKHFAVKQHTIEANPTNTTLSVNNNNNNKTNSSSGVNQYAFDSSRAQTQYVLKNKQLNVFKPIIVIVGISECKNMQHRESVLNDYINVKTMLHDIKKYDIIYQNKSNKVVHRKTQNNVIFYVIDLFVIYMHQKNKLNNQWKMHN